MSRRYRTPPGQLAAALIVSAGFIVIGLSTLSSPLRAGDVVVAVLVIVLGCVGAALRLTIHVTLTPDEISYRYNFRRRTIPWTSVESFRVGPAPGWGSWSCIVVEVRQRGGVRIPVVGRRRYVEGVLEDFEAYRAGLETVPSTKG